MNGFTCLYIASPPPQCKLLESREHLPPSPFPLPFLSFTSYSQLWDACRSTIWTNNFHCSIVLKTKTGNNLKAHQQGKWLNKSRHIHTMENYEARYWPGVGGMSIIYCFVDKAIYKIFRIILSFKRKGKTHVVSRVAHVWISTGKGRKGNVHNVNTDSLKGMMALEGTGDFIATVSLYFVILKY